MTKQILAFLFCFTRKLTPYSPLTYTLTSARELKPLLPPKARGFIKPLVLTLTLRLEPLGSIKPLVLPSALNRSLLLLPTLNHGDIYIYIIH